MAYEQKPKLTGRVIDHECPYCGSTDFEWGESETDDNGRKYKVTCNSCKQDFDACFTEVFAGYMVNTDNTDDEPGFMGFLESTEGEPNAK